MTPKYWLAIYFMLACGVLADEKWNPTSELVPFSKKLTDGSVLILEYNKYSETFTKTVSPEDNSKFMESKETVFRCRLAKVAGKEKEYVWERYVSIYGASGLWPRFIVKDVELFQGKIYILYTFKDGYLNLTILERQASNHWAFITGLRLDDHPRPLHECKLIQESGKMTLTCFDPNTVTPHEEKWDLINNVLMKRNTSESRKKEGDESK